MQMQSPNCSTLMENNRSSRNVNHDSSEKNKYTFSLSVFNYVIYIINYTHCNYSQMFSDWSLTYSNRLIRTEHEDKKKVFILHIY